MIRICSKVAPLSVLLAAVAISCAGCQEHKRLEAETAAAAERVKEMRTQLEKVTAETVSYGSAMESLRNEGQPGQAKSALETLQEEVSALQVEKSQLEKDIGMVEEARQQYKKENS